MSHQPFENWLFSKESLTVDQLRDLQAHLGSCETCRQVESAWLEVHQQFKRVPAVLPSPEFSLRWQVHLAERRQKLHRRHSWTLFAFSLGSALLLFGLLALRAIELLRSPGRLVLLAAYQFLSLVWYLKEALSSVSSFVNIVNSLVPWPAWFVFVGITALALALWLILFKKITQPRSIEL